MKLAELARRIGGTVETGGETEIQAVAGIAEASAGEVSFLANPRYASAAAATRASALIVAEEWQGETPAALIRTKNPDAAFATAAALFYTPAPAPAPGVHPTAVVAPDAVLGAGVSIGPLSVVESGAKIGAGTVISAQCYVGFQAEIGEMGFLYPQVSLRERVKIGARVIIHNGTVVGSDGFGYSVDARGVRTKIPQIGIVQIGDDVEIGANVTIDRARFGKTLIGNGVKIDNQVQVAHNVVLGDHVVLVAQVGIAGSTTIGARTIIAGQSGVAGHLHVGSGVIVGGQSGVTKDVPDGLHVMGMPAVPAEKMRRNNANVMLLPKFKERLAALAERVARLEEQLGGKA